MSELNISIHQIDFVFINFLLTSHMHPPIYSLYTPTDFAAILREHTQLLTTRSYTSLKYNLTYLAFPESSIKNLHVLEIWDMVS